MGNSYSAMGDLIHAQSHFDQGLALCYAHADRADADENLLPRAQTTGFLFLSSINLWQLGYADQALERGRQALTLAEESSNPGSVANVVLYCALLHMRRREPQLTEKNADALIKSSTESHWSYGVASGTALHGWAMAQQGQADTGIAQIRQGADAVAAFGIAATKVLLNTLLAEAYLQARQGGEALSITSESLQNIATTGGRSLFEGEMYRLKGEALLLQGSEADAEACFQRALEITRSRQAKAWELRAATSTARLWQKQGKGEQARALLQGVYGWFTEGFDTRDLEDARELLDALALR
jgi:predicted ATPase